MKRTLLLSLAVLLVPAMLSAQVIFNDSWADAGRNNGADPQDTDWWTSTSNQAIEVGAGYLGLVTTTTSGRGIHGTFGTQTLGVGDMLTATFTFTTPATVGSARSAGLRVGLFDTLGRALAADLTASSTILNPIYDGLPGYMLDFDVNSATANIQYRQHDVTQVTGQLMANTSPDYIAMSSGGSVYSFAANTSYTGVWSLKRTGADTLDLTGSLYQGANLLSTYAGTDSSGIVNTFGMLAFHVTSATFGTSNTAPDNGIDFSNIKLELVPAPVPEPSAIALLAIGVVGLLLRRRR